MIRAYKQLLNTVQNALKLIPGHANLQKISQKMICPLPGASLLPPTYDI